MREPQPHSAIGADADGEKKTVRIVQGSRYKWSDATKALYDCVAIQAVDAQKAELRVLHIGPDDEAELHEDAVETSRKSAMEDFRAVLAKEVTMLVREVAKCMVQVADSAATRHQDAMATAFNALVGVVQAQGQLSNNAVKQLLQMQRALGSNGAAQPSEEQMTQQLLMSVLAGQGGGVPTNGAPTNGAITLDAATLASLAQQFIASQGTGGAAPSGDA